MEDRKEGLKMDKEVKKSKKMVGEGVRFERIRRIFR